MITVLRRCFAVSLGLLVLALAGVGVLAWRMTQGPLDVTWLVARVVPHVAPGVSASRVTVALVAGARGRDLQIDATDAARTMTGQPTQTLRSAMIRLAVTPLLAARIEPTDLALDGLRLTIAAPSGPSGGGDPARLLSRLQHLTLTDAQADITGAVGQDASVRAIRAEITRDAGGVLRGQGSVVTIAGGLTSAIAAQGSYGPAGAQVTADIPSVNPAALARAIPALSAAGALDAEAAVHGEASFGPDLALLHAALHAQTGPGVVQLPAKGGGTSPGRFAAITLEAEGTPAAMTLRSLRLVLMPPSGNPATTVAITGTADRGGGRLAAHFAVDIDRLVMTDLGALWPERVGGNARAWLTENVTAGRAHDGHITFSLAGAATGDDIDVTEAGGTLTGDDLTVWWLRPVPPAQHAHAAVVWQTPDALLVSLSGVKQGGIEAKSGTVRITGLAGHDQVAAIETDLAGPLGDVLTLLKHPRLKLLSKHPIPVGSASGAVTAHLSVRLPLEGNVSVDQVAIHATGGVAGTHLGSIVAGRDLDRGQMAFDVTNDGLSITGPAEIAQIPAQLAVQMDFAAGPASQVVQHITAGLRLTKADAERAGLGGLGLDAGALVASVDYSERRDGMSAVQLGLDLKDAKLVTPLGWSKAAGTPGQAEARALLDHGRLVGLEGVRAAAPGLAVVARSELVGGWPSVVHLERGEIGRSSVTGTIVLPQHDGEPYRVTLAGPRLDLEARIKGRDTLAAPDQPTAGTPDKPGPPYVVDLRFDRVVLSPSRSLGPVTLTAAGEGQRLATARFATGGPERARADLVASPGGRRLTASAADLGALLRDTGVATELEGGALRVDGQFHDTEPGAPFVGTVDLRAFKVRGAATAGKVLQALTLYGVPDALRGPGLAFDRLASPFRWENSVLEIGDARAFSSSLGVTATGRVDLGRKRLDVTGTIVPAYFFNALPGRIPLIGRLFSPQAGSGVFAANYAVHGPVAEPSVSFNPLAALTPGFTRRFFDLFD